ncbi:putative polypeptide N-acetylgalactosaminyltransferase 9 [Halotydeus destructor]|nr:putative polypeptide N-acetylgalactosaminyltransferase 9 [Halotydeus destructor]
MIRRRSVFKFLLLIPASWLLVTLFINHNSSSSVHNEFADSSLNKDGGLGEKGSLVGGDGNGDRADDNKSNELNKLQSKALPQETLIKSKNRRNQNRLKDKVKGSKGFESLGNDIVIVEPPSDPDAPGEQGRGVTLPKEMAVDVKRKVDKGWQDNAFNQYISDMISVRRSLPDVRDPRCKAKDSSYLPPSSLPTTSVIICFHNEAWSVLLRTVHSVLDQSPAALIKEVILVDDYSNMAHLDKKLEQYMSKLSDKVKIVRAEKREGLIRARLLGAKSAEGDVLTYLDSHCECTKGWLEPLLDRIARDPTAVVCPVIDVISDKTFEYNFRGDASAINVGGFDWNLQFNWHGVPDREKKRRTDPTDPVRSPTMAGGLFSISKEFFERLGTYDSGFDIWGGENLELSFKTWMCGGTLEIVPCSHVGHIFRSRSPYQWRTGVNVLKRNSIRLAEVWMDEYKKYYYQRIGSDLGDFGDISDRLELRKNLQCKSFDWYIKTIYPELFIPGEAVASGELRNLGGDSPSKMCLDSPAHKGDMYKAVGLYPCHNQGGNQYWLLSKEGEIRRDEACLDYSGKEIILYPCHGTKGNQLWIYEDKNGSVRHGSSGKCLEMSSSRDKLLMRSCSANNPNQRWRFDNYDDSKFVSLV